MELSKKNPQGGRGNETLRTDFTDEKQFLAHPVKIIKLMKVIVELAKATKAARKLGP